MCVLYSTCGSGGLWSMAGKCVPRVACDRAQIPRRTQAGTQGLRSRVLMVVSCCCCCYCCCSEIVQMLVLLSLTHARPCAAFFFFSSLRPAILDLFDPPVQPARNTVLSGWPLTL
ncbi:hypothetical protein BO86DRAFT_107580 [Aspergillus japonicus CBS 114.51]|uniref:Uncharacterized protein n=1 Tax=Aspergillus japonicus CBS 114.51 TaxID=1448312 RepID=A0A8T8WZA9_ASPJA|nr:hypothetical protein BO86DRAFT_107580 [Aspergillus japonicus CBS 114.51]RAH81111.1 hypothetical protein BO86DRAFT_107580 [Aspergillus japonicus CBS 114.51]